MSPLYMIKSHGAWEGGGREPNKPTGVRHAILLTQTAGTSCSQIKHLNFYFAEQPRKNRRKSSLPLPKGYVESLCRVLAPKETGSPRQGLTWPMFCSLRLCYCLGRGWVSQQSRTAGHTDTHSRSITTSPGREYGLELRVWEFSIISYPGSGAGAPGLKHYYIIPLRKFFHNLFPNATSKEGMRFPF